MLKAICYFLFTVLPIKSLRILFNYSAKFIGPSSGILKEIKDIRISQFVKIRLYTPYSSSLEPLPVIIYYHGGGWILGSINAYDRIFQYLSYNSECILVAISYRKAPDYKFPVAIRDAILGYNWTVDNLKYIGGNKNKIVIAGDSAGGNIASVVLQNVLKTNKIKPALQILIYPILDVKNNALFKMQNNPNFFMKKIGYNILKYCLKQYLNKMEEINSNLISISLDITNLKYFPKTLIITAEFDPLTASITEYIADLKKARLKVFHRHFQGTVHGFLNFAKFYKPAKVALKEIISFIKMG